VQWLRVGAVAVGLGAAITTGQGVAAAEPSDVPDTAQSATSSTEAGDTEKNAAGDATEVGAGSSDGSASGSASSGISAHQPVSTVSAQQNTNVEKDAESEANAPDDAAAVEDLTTGPTDESTATGSVTDYADDLNVADTTPGTSSTGAAKESDGFITHKTAQVQEPDHHSQISAAQDELPGKTSPSATGTGGNAQTVSVVFPNPSVPPETVELATVPLALSGVSTPSTPAITAVSGAAPAAAATKVTLASIVTDMLTWIGLGPLAAQLPVPAWPVGPVVESLWLAVRDIHDRLTNNRPVALSIVAAGPTLTPDPLELADLLAHPDVAVNLNTDGSVEVIDGTFTDMTIATDVEAAQLFNRLAPLLGVPAGFAKPENITVERIGQSATPGDVAETVYRVHDSIGGIPVLGSEAILVTDGNGAVTGLFNNLDRLDGLNVALDARIDQSLEAIAFAAGAYMNSTPALRSGWPTWALFASSRFDPKLVVYALDPNAPPRLAWQVTVDPPQRFLALPDPSATYYIYANGADAGTVRMATSGAQGLSAISTTATDVLGQVRTINVAQETYFFFFQVASLWDLSRNIATYRTAFEWFGFGGPYVPRDPVTRGWFGWDPSAISGQANIATVYDYYNGVLGRPSFDGSGGFVQVVVEYNTHSPWSPGTYNNAYWDPGNRQLVFGDGGDLEGAVDVVGHEYTHAVVSFAIGQGGPVLDHGESGALNEAYADILGSLIEGKTGPGRWLVGEDSQWAGGAVRNIAVPSSIMTEFGPYRDNYATRYTGTGDDGGEHVNSTIFSHAAYQMMTDPATSDISGETWARVMYHSIFRLSPGATFVDGRAAVMDAAGEFGFTPEQLRAIERAFDDVGIVEPAQTMV
jgi:bacillolysin